MQYVIYITYIHAYTGALVPKMVAADPPGEAGIPP